MKGNPTQTLAALLLTGLLGALGQGVRAVAGLKKMNDDAGDSNASSADLFIASRLIINLLIGFVAGIVAGLSMGLTALFRVNIDLTNLASRATLEAWKRVIRRHRLWPMQFAISPMKIAALLT